MGRIQNMIGMAVLVLLAASCKLGKEYARPDLNLPETIDEQAADSVSVGAISWKTLYRDTVLQQLICQTLENNKDMKAAVARIREMEASRRVAKADLFPAINGRLFYDREYDESPDFAYEAKLEASWEVDLWGKLRWADQAALSDYLETVAGQRALRLSLVSQVAQAYFELIALDQELAIVKQTLQARQEGVRIAKLRFEGGLTSETSLRQAQLELAQTRTLPPGLEQQIRIKENEIALLAGRYPGRVERGSKLEEQQLPTELPVGLPSELLERRPDIAEAEFRLRRAHADVGIAFTSLFPRLSLTAHYGLESSQLSTFLKTPYYYLSAQLLEPLFNMGKNRARLRAKKAAYEQEVYAYEKTVLEAFSEVSDALVVSAKSREIRRARERLQEAARSTLELATLQYINGIISYLDVLDAQRAYFDAQVGLNHAVRDELLATVQLYKVLGGGVEVDDPAEE